MYLFHVKGCCVPRSRVHVLSRLLCFCVSSVFSFLRLGCRYAPWDRFAMKMRLLIGGSPLAPLVG